MTDPRPCAFCLEMDDLHVANCPKCGHQLRYMTQIEGMWHHACGDCGAYPCVEPRRLG